MRRRLLGTLSVARHVERAENGAARSIGDHAAPTGPPSLCRWSRSSRCWSLRRLPRVPPIRVHRSPLRGRRAHACARGRVPRDTGRPGWPDAGGRGRDASAADRRLLPGRRVDRLRSRRLIPATSRCPTRRRLPGGSPSSSSATAPPALPMTTGRARAWASEGYVVVAPTFPCPASRDPTPWRIETSVTRCETPALRARSCARLEPLPGEDGGFGGLLDPERIGAAGHSMGGLNDARARLGLPSRSPREGGGRPRRRLRERLRAADPAPVRPDHLRARHLRHRGPVPTTANAPSPPLDPPSTSSSTASRLAVSLRTSCPSSRGWAGPRPRSRTSSTTSLPRTSAATHGPALDPDAIPAVPAAPLPPVMSAAPPDQVVSAEPSW